MMMPQTQPEAGWRDEARPALRLTPCQWRTILESPSFLERADNRFQLPRRFEGAQVQIIPDESFR